MVTANQRGTLNRRLLAQAALAIADDQGLGGVTIRAVAQRLHVAPMSLYSHVSDKDDLLGAMVELAFEAADPPTAIDAPDWQDRLERILLSIQQVFREHPSVFALAYSTSRRVRALTRLRRAVLDSLLDAGLSPEVAALLYRTIGSYAVGHVFLEQQSYGPPTNENGEGKSGVEFQDVFGGGDPIEGTEGFLRGLRVILASHPFTTSRVRMNSSDWNR